MMVSFILQISTFCCLGKRFDKWSVPRALSIPWWPLHNNFTWLNHSLSLFPCFYVSLSLHLFLPSGKKGKERKESLPFPSFGPFLEPCILSLLPVKRKAARGHCNSKTIGNPNPRMIIVVHWRSGAQLKLHFFPCLSIFQPCPLNEKNRICSWLLLIS